MLFEGLWRFFKDGLSHIFTKQILKGNYFGFGTYWKTPFESFFSLGLELKISENGTLSYINYLFKIL